MTIMITIGRGLSAWISARALAERVTEDEIVRRIMAPPSVPRMMAGWNRMARPMNAIVNRPMADRIKRDLRVCTGLVLTVIILHLL